VRYNEKTTYLKLCALKTGSRLRNVRKREESFTVPCRMTYTRRTKRNCALHFQFRPAYVFQMYSLLFVDHMFCMLLFNFVNYIFFLLYCVFFCYFKNSYCYVCSVVGIMLHAVLCIVCV